MSFANDPIPVKPARTKGALVEQAAPLSLEDMRTVYRKRMRDTKITDGARDPSIVLLDRMLVTLFVLVEGKPLPTERTLTGAPWE